MQPPVCPTHSRLLNLTVEIAAAQLRNERETLRVYRANKQSRWKPGGFEIHSSSAHSDRRCLYVQVQVRRDGAFGVSRVTVRDDPASAGVEDATKMCKWSCFTYSETRVSRCRPVCERPF